MTVFDIYYCVNEIAIKNDYNALHEEGGRRRDPNRIYPGRVFVLPNNTQYVVELKDTMWGIAAGYIRGNIRELCRAYDELVKPHRPGAVPAAQKAEVAGAIRDLVDRCKSENLRRVFEEKLRNL
jgi:hypothetical protein